MQAAATTGPKREPRPTSSTPATSLAPDDQASFSNFSVHLRRLRRRSLAAAGERGLPVFGSTVGSLRRTTGDSLARNEGIGSSDHRKIGRTSGKDSRKENVGLTRFNRPSDIRPSSIASLDFAE